MDASAIFEAEVRRVAAELFPRAKTSGPVMVDGRERDGVFDNGEVVHIIEATISKRKDKAEGDLKKSADLVKFMRRERPDVNFKIWFVTQNDPTVEQVTVGSEVKKQSKCPVEVCSFRVFSSKLVDAASYLQLRENHPFGSVRNPADENDFRVPANEYIPMDLVNFETKDLVFSNDLSKTLTDNAGKYLLVGDFGAGKSMTMRHAYYDLKLAFLNGTSNKFPVYLNLRDHFGQRNPSEALLRHADEIGFPLPNQLVAAWKAGNCHIFLDGFDELSSTRLVRSIGGLRQARREAMRLVYNFVSNHPKDTSIFLSGREHYFDSLEELKGALGFSDRIVHLTLNEFTYEQVVNYLERKGFGENVPDWLPSRPLLLGYLAIKGVLSGGEHKLSALSREAGWDYLLSRICERESKQIDPVSIDPSVVREFVERLSTSIRKTNSGRGPIHLNDIHKIFEDVFGQPPDEKAETLIFRMPGLTSATGLHDTREFIDDDYVDACRSGDVVRFVNSPHDGRLDLLAESTIQMRDLGCSIAAHKLRAVSQKKISTAVENAVERDAPYLALDIIRIMQHLGRDYVGQKVALSGGIFEEYQVTKSPIFDNLTFDGCYFSNIEIDDIEASSPQFFNCDIERIFGCVGVGDLPPCLKDSSNSIGNYVDEAKTNADILDLPIPISTRVLMTILRKLFVQAGRGRRENALYRGLDSRSKAYVPEILALLEQLDFAIPHKLSGPIVWIPNRNFAKQAYEILKSPQNSAHEVSRKVRAL